MHRLIMRYVGARLTYLGGARESQHIPPNAPDSARKLCRLVDTYRLCVFRPDTMLDRSREEIKTMRYAWQKAFNEHPHTLLDSPPEMPVHLQQQRLRDDTIGKDGHDSTEVKNPVRDDVGGRQLSVTLGKRSRSPAKELSSEDWPPAKKATAERRVGLGRWYRPWSPSQYASVPGSSHDGLHPPTPEPTHSSGMPAIKNEYPNDPAGHMTQTAYGKKPRTPSLLTIWELTFPLPGPQHAGAKSQLPLRPANYGDRPMCCNGNWVASNTRRGGNARAEDRST